MKEGRNVIPDRELSAQRLLDAISTVADMSLELALDTDTQDAYDRLAVPDNMLEGISKRSWLRVFAKSVGVMAACFMCVLMMISGGSSSTDYMPDIDRTKPIIIIWKRDRYRTMTEPAELQGYALDGIEPEEMLGSMVSYLRISGENEYKSTKNMTQMILYTCQDREGLYILEDQDGYMFVIPMEE